MDEKLDKLLAMCERINPVTVNVNISLADLDNARKRKIDTTDEIIKVEDMSMPRPHGGS